MSRPVFGIFECKKCGSVFPIHQPAAIKWRVSPKRKCESCGNSGHTQYLRTALTFGQFSRMLHSKPTGEAA